MRNNADHRIPDHSQSALSEAYEAALICAAFRKMEDEEMKWMNQPLTGDAASEQLSGRVRRGMRTRRMRRTLAHTLPRAAQLAACLIAVVAVGAGVALAASSDARHWAAGILTGSKPAQSEGFSFGNWADEADAGFVDGAALGDDLYLYDLNSATLRVLTGSDVEPILYRWDGQGACDIQYMASHQGEIYLLGETGRAQEDTGEDMRFTVGRLTLNGDGTFSVAPIGELSAGDLFDRQGRAVSSCGLSGAAAGDGRLYFLTHCEIPVEGAWFGEMCDRLFAYELASGDLSEIELPAADTDEIRHPVLFNGRDGHAFLAIEDFQAGVSRVFQIGPDGTLGDVAEIPASENRYASCLAYRESDDALCYVLNGSLWVAPGCDPARARRMAATAEAGGRGLPIGENSYLIINKRQASIFDLDDVPDEIGQLVTNGDTGSRRLGASFSEKHPDVAIVKGDSAPYAGDFSGVPNAEPTGTDVWMLFDDSFAAFRKAGFAEPLTSDVLKDAVGQMLPGIQRCATIGNSVSAVPLSFYVYSDVTIDRETWANLGYAPEQMPETWLELMTLLRDRSRSANSRAIPIADGSTAPNAADFAVNLYLRMAYSFVNNWEAQGLPIDFASDDFRAAMERFREIDFSAFAYDQTAGIPGCLFYMGSNDISPMMMSESFSEIVLRTSEDAPRVARVSGSFASIDPNSANKALAQAYLERIVALYEDDEWQAMTGRAADNADPDAAARIETYRQTFDDVNFCTALIYSDAEVFDGLTRCAAPYLSGECSFEAFAAAMNDCLH